MRMDEMYLIPKAEYEHLLSLKNGEKGESEGMVKEIERSSVGGDFNGGNGGESRMLEKGDEKVSGEEASESPSKEKLGAIKVIPSRERAHGERGKKKNSKSVAKKNPTTIKRKKVQKKGGSCYTLW